MNKATCKQRLLEIQDERNELLKRQLELWNAGCLPCNKIEEGKAEGILHKSASKDRSNVVCSACPYQYGLTSIGQNLTRLTKEKRRIASMLRDVH